MQRKNNRSERIKSTRRRFTISYTFNLCDFVNLICCKAGQVKMDGKSGTKLYDIHICTDLPRIGSCVHFPCPGWPSSSYRPWLGRTGRSHRGEIRPNGAVFSEPVIIIMIKQITS